MKDYNVCVSHSNYAKKYYLEARGHSLQKNCGSVRWWVSNDIVENSVHPHLYDGKLQA